MFFSSRRYQTKYPCAYIGPYDENASAYLDPFLPPRPEQCTPRMSALSVATRTRAASLYNSFMACSFTAQNGVASIMNPGRQLAISGVFGSNPNMGVWRGDTGRPPQSTPAADAMVYAHLTASDV
jgi:hypothetical protein